LFDICVYILRKFVYTGKSKIYIPNVLYIILVWNSREGKARTQNIVVVEIGKKIGQINLHAVNIYTNFMFINKTHD
jgi:CTP synthase (UTP-ammonia lyase)